MNIPEIAEKLKGVLANDEIYTFLLVTLVGVAAFGLGRASVLPPVSLTAASETANLEQSRASEAYEGPEIENKLNTEEFSVEASSQASEALPGQYVASKSGTKYHLPWCGGAKQIKEENKVWFASKEEAEVAGYAPAANCKGI